MSTRDSLLTAEQTSSSKRGVQFESMMGGRSMKQELKAVVTGAKSIVQGKYMFHTFWTVYITLMSLLGGLIMHGFDGGNFVNSWFFATSSLVNSGLTVVEPRNIHKSTYIVSSILQIMGSAVFLLLPTIAYRIYKLHQLKPLMEQFIEESERDGNSMVLRPTDISTQIRKDCTENNSAASKLRAIYVEQHLHLYYGSIATFYIVVIYIISWVLFGWLFVTLSLYMEPLEPELDDRGFTYMQNGLYCAISAFTNSGLTLSNNSYLYMNSNASVLVASTVLILAGNIFLPMLLRLYLIGGLKICQHCNWRKWEKALTWSLQNPRRITTHIFLADETFYLAQFSLLFNGVIIFLFIVVELYRDHLGDVYGTYGRIFGLGCFQIINIRHCGFTSIAMSDLTQSTLFVFAIAMYVSPLPFIGLLTATGEASRRKVDGKPPSDGGYAIFGVLRKVVVRFFFFKIALIFVLASCENDLMDQEPTEVNLWYLIFELASAYGLVGLTVGVPGKAVSLSGRFSVAGKLCVIAAFFVGKHRGLPIVRDPIIDFEFLHLRQVLNESTSEHPVSTLVDVVKGDDQGIHRRDSDEESIRNSSMYGVSRL